MNLVRVLGKKTFEYQLAVVHIGLGETEAAMEALQQTYREHSTLLNYVKIDPRFDPLRGNPQFQDLCGA